MTYDASIRLGMNARRSGLLIAMLCQADIVTHITACMLWGRLQHLQEAAAVPPRAAAVILLRQALQADAVHGRILLAPLHLPRQPRALQVAFHASHLLLTTPHKLYHLLRTSGTTPSHASCLVPNLATLAFRPWRSRCDIFSEALTASDCKS